MAHTELVVEPTSITLDPDTRSLVAEWVHHLSAKPDIPADYAAHIDHLRIEMDRWTTHENALRVVVADHLLDLALRALGGAR